MERLLRLHFSEVVQGDTRDPMSLALGTTLETDVLQWVPGASVAAIPWASMTKSRAITEACRLVADAPASFLFAQRALAETVHWTPEAERRIVFGQASNVAEAVAALDNTLTTPRAFVGAPCRARFLQKRECACSGPVSSEFWVRGTDAVWRNVHTKTTQKEGASWEGCTSFASIPKSAFLVGIRGQAVLLGTFKAPQLSFQTTVRDADMLEVEIVPSGSIVLTASRRNEDTGGSLQQETVAFRVTEDAHLESVTLTAQEVKEAEAQALVQDTSKEYDLSRVSSPLCARVVSPWKADIVLQEDIVFQDEGHGTVVGIMGHANDMWIAHATGMIVHVNNGVVTDRLDLGFACTHAVSFPSLTRDGTL